jgi:hypothetical protein
MSIHQRDELRQRRKYIGPNNSNISMQDLRLHLKRMKQQPILTAKEFYTTLGMHSGDVPHQRGVARHHCYRRTDELAASMPNHYMPKSTDYAPQCGLPIATVATTWHN